MTLVIDAGGTSHIGADHAGTHGAATGGSRLSPRFAFPMMPTPVGSHPATRASGCVTES